MTGTLVARTISTSLLVAQFLARRGVRRFFGLQGGHIQPIWDHAATLGIEIVDVRDEGAAVHMAHAHAELTGELGVAMVTAGPGVTNTVTAVANASIARVPLLVIGGCPPRPQDGMGPLQGIAHVEVMKPITRHAITARVADQVLRELDLAVARAFGDGGEPGPVYIEFPTDVLREAVAAATVLEEFSEPKAPRVLFPDPAGVRRAVDLLWSAQRPLVISGRGAKRASHEVVRFLDALGAIYLDTQESRGLVPSDHRSQAGAMRGRAMQEADVVLVLGRKLDYQLGYGSPVAFPQARFIRISDTADELIDNRRGEVEVLASVGPALDAIVACAAGRSSAVDAEWTSAIAAGQADRTARYAASLAKSPPGADGAMHPNQIFAAIREAYDPATTIAIADGGDIMSFARLGLNGAMYLDSGAFGCLGVGVPYAIAAKRAYPSHDVIAVVGDGSFGFNAMEIDTAVRHAVPIVVIVANNAAWNIERHDQVTNYGGRVVGTDLRSTDYAALARALGAHGERIMDPAELPAALRRARAHTNAAGPVPAAGPANPAGPGNAAGPVPAVGPVVIDVVVTRDAVSSDGSKGLAIVPDYQALADWDTAEQKRRATRSS
jgi:acetolactate synthase-1/2/3 large subunit